MPNEYIGDTEIASINNIDPSQEQSSEEIDVVGLDDPITVEMSKGLKALTLETTLVKMIHSQDYSVETQREAAKALVESQVANNTFDYLDWRGWLSVSSVDAPWEENMRNLVNATLDTSFLPYDQYRPGYRLVGWKSQNDFGLESQGNFNLPASAQNVELTVPARRTNIAVNKTDTISSEDGNIDYYDYLSWFDTSSLTTPSVGHITAFRGSKSGQISSSGGRVYQDSITIPDGSYILKVRVQSSGTTADEIGLFVDKDGVRETTSVHTASAADTPEVFGTAKFEVSGETLRVGVEKQSGATDVIDVDGVWLVPQVVPTVEYDYDLSGSFHDSVRTGPVRVYDLGTGEKVTTVDHTFEGDVRVENGRVAWETTGKSWQVEVFDGSVYQGIYGDTSDWQVEVATLKEITPEKVRVDIMGQDRNGSSFSADLIVRQDPFIEIAVTSSNVTNQYVNFTNTTDRVGEADKVIHKDDTTNSSISSSGTDNWSSLVQGTVVGLFGGTSGINRYWLTDTSVGSVQVPTAKGDSTYLGGVPLSGASNLYDGSPPTSTGNVAEHSYGAGTDLPHGAYLIGWRISSSGGESVTITTEVDGVDVSIDGRSAGWTTATTTSDEYYIRYFETTTDGTFLSEVTSSSPSAITVSDVGLVPLSLDGRRGTQEVMHEAVKELEMEPVLNER